MFRAPARRAVVDERANTASLCGVDERQRDFALVEDDEALDVSGVPLCKDARERATKKERAVSCRDDDRDAGIRSRAHASRPRPCALHHAWISRGRMR